jgi:lipopolysaccharide export system protein LptA
MTYDRDRRTLRYDGDVDIRQGPDRIRSAAAAIFLTQKNEVARTVMERDVVITQPGRRALGDSAHYDAERDIVVLRGRPARVEDQARGFSEGAELTVYLNEGRVIGDGRSKSDPAGRTRSVYRVQE